MTDLISSAFLPYAFITHHKLTQPTKAVSNCHAHALPENGEETNNY